MREWKAKNPEKVRMWNRGYKLENADKVKVWNKRSRQRNPEASRRAAKKYKEANREKVSAKYAEWKKANLDYFNKWAKENRRRKPELYLWRSAKNRAKAEGIEFNIEVSDICIPDKCPVLGMDLVKGGEFSLACASLDRVIPFRGYTKGNVVVISLKANAFKRDGTPDELMKVAIYARDETARVLAELGDAAP